MPVWTGAENLGLHRGLIPSRTAPSDSLYRLSPSGPQNFKMEYLIRLSLSGHRVKVMAIFWNKYAVCSSKNADRGQYWVIQWVLFIAGLSAAGRTESSFANDAVRASASSQTIVMLSVYQLYIQSCRWCVTCFADKKLNSVYEFRLWNIARCILVGL